MQAFRVRVNRPIEFLTSVLEAFSADEAAQVSFEGELRMLREADLTGTSSSETTCLRRQTMEPLQDFMVITLSPRNLPVLRSLYGRVGLRARVLHVQIEVGGALVFGAYDQFDPSGVWVSPRFTEATLSRLQGQQVIASYERVEHLE